MASVAFIETAVVRGECLMDDAAYAISRAVRVREEAFGLLFYDTGESRLTFVRSGELLQIKIQPDGSKTISADMTPQTRAKVRRLLDNLIKKRLICAS